MKKKRLALSLESIRSLTAPNLATAKGGQVGSIQGNSEPPTCTGSIQCRATL